MQHAERPQFPGPHLRRTRCPDTSSKATLWMKAQQEGALTPPCISEKPAGSTHITKMVLSLNNLRCKRSSIPPQNTRPDTPEQTQQGPCNLSQIRLQEVRSRTLRFLPQLEMRPTSIAPNPEESREASPKSTVSLTSQRHPETLPEVTGTSQGNPGFPAATLERHRESFFNPS